MQDFGAAFENIMARQSMAACSGRFRILDEAYMVLPRDATATDGTNTNSSIARTGYFSFYWKPRVPKTVNIKSGSSTPNVSQTVDCNIFLLSYAVNGSSAEGVTVVGTSRAYYCD